MSEPKFKTKVAIINNHSVVVTFEENCTDNGKPVETNVYYTYQGNSSTVFCDSEKSSFCGYELMPVLEYTEGEVSDIKDNFMRTIGDIFMNRIGKFAPIENNKLENILDDRKSPYKEDATWCKNMYLTQISITSIHQKQKLEKEVEKLSEEVSELKKQLKKLSITVNPDICTNPEDPIYITENSKNYNQSNQFIPPNPFNNNHFNSMYGVPGGGFAT